MPKVFVIQAPRNPQDFDMDALESLGDVEYVMPAAPNIHDDGRMHNDFSRLLSKINNSVPDDIFVMLGGSPISNSLWGAAVYASERDSINVAFYSRDVDQDGRRLDAGRYRIVPMNWDAIVNGVEAQPGLATAS